MEIYTKHLGLSLDAKRNFSEHTNEKLKKNVKGISVINVGSSRSKKSFFFFCFNESSFKNKKVLFLYLKSS